MVTCTGCSLLCEDIEVILEHGKIKETRNACRRGAARFRGCRNRLVPTVEKNQTDVDTAIQKAAGILRHAKSPMIFGFDNSTCETHPKAIQLAKELGAVIDDSSSFCQGLLIERVLGKKFRTCSLEDVRNKADVLVYWGSDAQDSQPRHLSRFSVFPRGESRQRGYEEDRLAIAIDVRESNTAKICKGHFYRIPFQGDREFIMSLMDALAGRVPKYDPKKILELAGFMKKADFGVLFTGIGLTYSIKEDIDILVTLADKLPNFHIMPMVGHYNMRGFNETLFRETGFVNRVKFDGKPVHDNKYAIVEVLKQKSIDALLIAGSDPLSSLPGSVLPHLASIPVICIDPCVTLTSTVASVTIPAASSGIESGGSAVRMDGKLIAIPKVIETDYLADVEIIRRLVEGL